MEQAEDICGGELPDLNQYPDSETGVKPITALVPTSSRAAQLTALASDDSPVVADFSYPADRSDGPRPLKKARLPIVPRPLDVLLGRGKGRRRYPGNVRMADIVDQHRSRYFAQTNKSDKTGVIQDIVAAVQSCEGGVRFLKELPGGNEWVEAEESVAHSRVSQYLRYKHGNGQGPESDHIQPGWDHQSAQLQQSVKQQQDVHASSDTRESSTHAAMFDIAANVVDRSAVVAYPPTSSDWNSFSLLQMATDSSMSHNPALQAHHSQVPTGLRTGATYDERGQLIGTQPNTGINPVGPWSTQDQHQQTPWLPQQSFFAPQLGDRAQGFSRTHVQQGSGNLQFALEEIPVMAQQGGIDCVSSLAAALQTKSSTEESQETFGSNLDQLFDDD
jgi:hypothetical protein